MDAGNLPPAIANSNLFTPLQLQRLATIASIPPVDATYEDNTLQQIFQYYSLHNEELSTEVYRYAAQLIDEGSIAEAWQVLLSLDVY